jgi:hypothetical protein
MKKLETQFEPGGEVIAVEASEAAPDRGSAPNQIRV